MSPPDIHQKVRRNFGQKAEVYDYYAQVQQQIVDRLVRRIQHVALPFEPRILEIGSGTGVLTRRMQQLWPHARYVVSDASHDMLLQARKQISGRSRTAYVVMDAANLAVDQKFDLIVSSMILHWLPRPAETIRQIVQQLNPGGIFAFSMLTESSFEFWRMACDKAGAPCGLWDYPKFDQIRSIPGVLAIQERIQTFYDCAEDFLHNLKSIGSGTPKPGYNPQSPTQLKAVLKIANKIKPFVVNYQVAFGASHATSGIADLPNAMATSPMPL